MVATTPKIPAIKVFTLISLMAFCRYSFVTFATGLGVALIMKIKRTAWAKKMASFSAPSQICPVIKRFTPSVSKMKLPTQKTKIDDFKFKIAIFCTSPLSLLLSSAPSLFSSIFTFGDLFYDNKMIEFAFFFYYKSIKFDLNLLICQILSHFGGEF